jgi:hypothetical protein
MPSAATTPTPHSHSQNVDVCELVLTHYIHFGKAELKAAKSNLQASRVYEKIADKIKARDIEINKTMVKDMISNAKKKFKKERQKKSGHNEPSEWHLFDLAMEAFSDEHDIVPPTIVESPDDASGEIDGTPTAQAGTQVKVTKESTPKTLKMTSFQKEYFKRLDRFLDLYEKDINKRSDQ